MGFSVIDKQSLRHPSEQKTAYPRRDFVESGYRYYNPALGRWISKDPLGEAGGVMLYGFVGNDGLNRVDYLGYVDTDFFKVGGEASIKAYEMTMADKPEVKEGVRLVLLNRPEYGGRICCKDGEYKYTKPDKTLKWVLRNMLRGNDGVLVAIYDVEGGQSRVSLSELKSCAKEFGEGWGEAGFYHAHPSGAGFSDTDKNLTSPKPLFVSFKGTNDADIVVQVLRKQQQVVDHPDPNIGDVSVPVVTTYEVDPSEGNITEVGTEMYNVVTKEWE